MKIARVGLAALYAGANAPFAYKYASRYGGDGAMAASAWLAFAAFLWLLGPWLARHIARFDRRGWLYAGMVALAALAIAAVFHRFDSSLLRVTRAPAIIEWTDRLLAGQFPYAATSRPSAFPVWFLIALPFRWLGDLGWMQVAGFIGFAVLCRRVAGAHAGRAWLSVGLLLVSPLFAYEVVTRSELATNTTLALAVLLFLESTPVHGPGWFVQSLGLGLVLSTRGIVGLACAVVLPWLYRNRLGAGAVVAAVAAITFALTLAPFVFWDRVAFFRDGPFSIQLSYAPPAFLLTLGATAVVCGWRARDGRAAWLSVAVLLYAAIAGVFAYSIVTEGWHSVLLDDGFDISYFAFGQTALLAAMARAGQEETPGSD